MLFVAAVYFTTGAMPVRQVRCPCDRCDARATDSHFLSVKFNAHALTYVFPLVIVIIFRLLLLPSFFRAVMGKNELYIYTHAQIK